MIDIVSALFEAHGYEKINLEQGFLFLYPNSMEKKDFWIVIEEDDLSSVVLRQRLYPSMIISPLSISSSLLMQRIRVDFPLPLGPQMTTISPSVTEKLIFLRT